MILLVAVLIVTITPLEKTTNPSPNRKKKLKALPCSSVKADDPVTSAEGIFLSIRFKFLFILTLLTVVYVSQVRSQASGRQ